MASTSSPPFGCPAAATNREARSAVGRFDQGSGSRTELGTDLRGLSSEVHPVVDHGGR